MASRLELQTKLEEILGSRNVYFQPPASVQMQYDAIVYERSGIRNLPADNLNYSLTQAYEVTVIYRDPDCDVPMKLAELPMCRMERHYVVDNLNHDVFTLYY